MHVVPIYWFISWPLYNPKFITKFVFWVWQGKWTRVFNVVLNIHFSTNCAQTPTSFSVKDIGLDTSVLIAPTAMGEKFPNVELPYGRTNSISWGFALYLSLNFCPLELNSKVKTSINIKRNSERVNWEYLLRVRLILSVTMNKWLVKPSNPEKSNFNSNRDIQITHENHF